MEDADAMGEASGRESCGANGEESEALGCSAAAVMGREAGTCGTSAAESDEHESEGSAPPPSPAPPPNTEKEGEADPWWCACGSSSSSSRSLGVRGAYSTSSA